MVARDIKYGGRAEEAKRSRPTLTETRGRFVTAVETDESGRQLPPDGVGTPAATVLDLRQRGPLSLVLSSQHLTASLSASQNNYEPTGFLAASLIRVSATVPVNITGFGRDGNEHAKVLMNTGANTITLVHESGSSTANKRMNLKSAANFALAAGAAVWLVYDSVNDRWRLIGA